jgi:hypothetical protein
MQIHVTKQIAAPVAIVFDVFSDITKIDERISGITKVVMLSDMKRGVGVRWRETRVIFGQEATEEMEISDFKINQSYDVVSSSRGTDYHIRHTFTPKDGGTQVDMIFSSKPTSFPAKLISPLGFLFKGATRKMLESDLDELKVLCERLATA